MEYVQSIMSVGASFIEAIHLSGDLTCLRMSLPKAHFLIDRAEWGRFRDKGLTVLLLQLKDTTYDCKDLLREFDDQVLRQKTEDANRSRAGQLVSSSFNLFKSWISGSKSRVQDAQSNLDKVMADTEGMLNLMGLNVEPPQLGKQLMPETSSLVSEPIVGRDEERDLVINLLGVQSAKRRSSKRLKGDSAVLPMVGIGGVGKTTLAQLVYNDPRVKSHFEMRMWVCVSDIFDIKRVTKEILGSIKKRKKEIPSSIKKKVILGSNPADMSGPPPSSLDALQVELEKELKEHKFLIVLDDVWPDANKSWSRFVAPLRYGHQGSVILVTTRSLKVAYVVGTMEPVKLEGLKTDIFWDFFEKCAFGKEHPESYPHLQGIGQSLVSKLCGSPLAAKTLGRLLNGNLTEEHWRSIHNSELWELPYEEDDILPALQLSYFYLPQELKRCFAVSSMFPKDYSFARDEIVELWVALGLVATGGSMRVEEIGCIYLDDLRSRFLLQDDPQFLGRNRYVMHDLIHDMAQSISAGECFLLQDLSCQNQKKIPQTIRHMSILLNNEALGRMASLDHLNKLHSLRFQYGIGVEIPWFSQLSNILFLSLKGCDLLELPKEICVLSHLRHLDISKSRIVELPEKLWSLYSLQVFDASDSDLRTIHPGVTNLVKLRRLALPEEAFEELSKISGLGNLYSLRNLRYFTVGVLNGKRIGELKGMNQLTGKLSIKRIANVQSTAEAVEARLADKQYLKKLVLEWRRSECSLRTTENEILQALCPPPSIEGLKVRGFGGDVLPSWLSPKYLPAMKFLQLVDCGFLQQLLLPAGNVVMHLPFISLTTLCLRSCKSLTNVDHFLCPEYLPSITSVEIHGSTSLVSLPVHNFVGFIRLQNLEIHECPSLICPREMILPPSLQRLSISSCGELDKSFRPGGCLDNLSSLNLLRLEQCHNVESILLNSINTHKMEHFILLHLPELSSIDGPHALSSIQHVFICVCPKLTQVQQPFIRDSSSP
uniref:Uncharacterized protein n=1 Tax=Avena sativa TaxID=4498 RepID=A0ACD5UK72_AVESA